MSGSDDTSVKIWDLRQGHLLYTLLGHQGGVNTAKYNSTGEAFATGGADAKVMMWRGNDCRKGGEVEKGRKTVMKAKDENVRSEKISEELAGTLDKLVTQLDFVTRTMVMLDQRISGFEEHIEKLTERIMGRPNEVQIE